MPRSKGLGGRPKGSTTRPKVTDYLSPEEMRALTLQAYHKAMEGDSLLIKFFLEQHFGKAVQPISDSDGGSLVLAFHNVFNPARKAN